MRALFRHTHTNTIADSLPEPRAQSLGHCPDAGSRSASHQGKNRPGWTATGVFCHSQLFRGVQFINFWIVRGKKRGVGERRGENERKKKKRKARKTKSIALPVSHLP